MAEHAGGPADLAQAIRDAVAELNHDDRDRGAMAAATLTLLAQQADEREPLLQEAVAPLVHLVNTGGGALQKNACVALISIVQLGPACWQAAADQATVAAAVGLLGGAKADPAARVNGAVLAGAMIEGGAAGPGAFYAAGGVAALQQALRSDTEAMLLEAAADDVCKLAAEPGARQPLLDAGVLADLARLLPLRDQPEVLLRALMGCAMLLGDRADRLRELAAVPGAARALAALLQRRRDGNCTAIAGSLFRAMAEDAEAKKLMAADLQTGGWPQRTALQAVPE